MRSSSTSRSIELELEYGSSGLRMLVRDNGRGMDAQVLKSGSDGHWGLPGMRERAERIGARFKVWSSASAGTEIELSVPGHVAFAQDRSDRRRGFTARWRRHDATFRRDERMGKDL